MHAFLINLTTVAGQVFILFLLMAIGFATGKAKLFNDAAIKCVADFCLMFATPAVIIKSFMRKFEPSMAKTLLLALLGAAICHVVGITVGKIFFRCGDNKQRKMLQNSTMLSNAGFMALPLQTALLGSDGSFYGAAYVIMLTIVLWTYSYTDMSMGKEKMNIKKIILNPGIIAVIIGTPIFVLSLSLPEPIAATVNHIANLNTPLPMIVVGYYLSNTSFKKVFSNARGLLCVFARLLIVPLICLLLLYLLGFRGSMYISTVIAASAPIAVAVTMFSARFDGYTELSANMVSVSTLFAVFTMPLVVALAQTLA